MTSITLQAAAYAEALRLLFQRPDSPQRPPDSNKSLATKASKSRDVIKGSAHSASSVLVFKDNVGNGSEDSRPAIKRQKCKAQKISDSHLLEIPDSHCILPIYAVGEEVIQDSASDPASDSEDSTPLQVEKPEEAVTVSIWRMVRRIVRGKSVLPRELSASDLESC